MNGFVDRLDWTYDVQKLVLAYYSMDIPWSRKGSIAITCSREELDGKLMDAVHGGATERSIFNGEVVRKDEWYDQFIPYFEKHPAIQNVWEDMNQRLGKVFRMRFMRMEPMEALSFHTDATVRYHIPLITNTNCFFFIDEGLHVWDPNPKVEGMGVYHLPADGGVFRVNTKERHTAYNGGNQSRMHLVLSAHD